MFTESDEMLLKELANKRGIQDDELDELKKIMLAVGDMIVKAWGAIKETVSKIINSYLEYRDRTDEFARHIRLAKFEYPKLPPLNLPNLPRLRLPNIRSCI